MAMPKVLIIIVTWNKEEYVLNLLKSLQNIEYQRASMKIVVVDNASTDTTVESIKALYKDVTLLCNEENLGGTGGFNTGLKWASEQPAGSFDYLWLLDNDVVVNRYALIELVELLESTPDAAVAGSTMMQQDYPWRINEVGSFYNRNTGELVFNLHLTTIHPWKGRAVEEMLDTKCDLSHFIPDYHPSLDVDYVAAASLLIRSDVAAKAGLWLDCFIHFDDVEWCLRISEMGYRVLVSCRSLIWHMSAVVKVPTWVVYYDCRNALTVLKKYAKDKKNVARAVRRQLYKATFLKMIGRCELADLVLDAVDDYRKGRMGRKDDICLPPVKSHHQQLLSELPFMDPNIKKILVSWHVNLHATKIQEKLVKTVRERPDITIDFLTFPGGDAVYQFPGANMVAISMNRMLRMIQYYRLRGKYDLVIQSDYKRVLFLSWLDSKIMFLNNENYCLRSAPTFLEMLGFLKNSIFKRLFAGGSR
ncbi:hypothetical protein MTBBW1_2030068 [Desulfamplus magnetovallimortis]|uniref:Glycosyltransferase 2-like domain-containing protein n=1 Tax=Desulfamplus magnetovallimortis TaxID=1246637 RepID=A0A1W1HC72_9BACT|nr:glycosyltransferase family 2 protein [Desulfamplus magnetovallimortis]SLM29978.1 hypothetical protein MTBBW1_2030068 [Desulfamplus magnetovallimortis]